LQKNNTRHWLVAIMGKAAKCGRAPPTRNLGDVTLSLRALLRRTQVRYGGVKKKEENRELETGIERRHFVF